MAITNYATLASAVASLLDVNYADISAVADVLIANGEKRIFREVRTRHMETAIATAIANGVIALPSDYVETRYAFVDGSPDQLLEMVPASFIYAKYPPGGDTGKPLYMAQDGGNLIFGPSPDSGYTVQLAYYRRLDAVQTSATSFFLANTDLYCMAALLETDVVLGRDGRYPLWEGKYRMIKDLVNAETTKGRFSGPLTMR